MVQYLCLDQELVCDQEEQQLSYLYQACDEDSSSSSASSGKAQYRTQPQSTILPMLIFACVYSIGELNSGTVAISISASYLLILSSNFTSAMGFLVLLFVHWLG
jgi:hypothetical protein